MGLIDSHSHIYLEQFDADLDEVIDRAKRMGIDRILLPNIDSSTIERLEETCLRFPDVCSPMMGLHPCSVKENYQRELGIIEQKLKDNKYVAIGEIGIDLHWDKSTLTWQEDAFRQQILWAKEMGLPIVIHARESFDEIFAVVDEMNDDRLTGIFHCFTGTPAQAEKIIDYGGFMLGLGGVLTYKNSGLAETIKNIDPGYVILETDAPYLSPVPYRGKRNEPSYMVEVAKRLALAWEISYDQVVSQSEENTKRIFSLKTFDSYKNR